MISLSIFGTLSVHLVSANSVSWSRVGATPGQRRGSRGATAQSPRRAFLATGPFPVTRRRPLPYPDALGSASAQRATGGGDTEATRQRRRGARRDAVCRTLTTERSSTGDGCASRLVRGSCARPRGRALLRPLARRRGRRGRESGGRRSVVVGLAGAVNGASFGYFGQQVRVRAMAPRLRGFTLSWSGSEVEDLRRWGPRRGARCSRRGPRGRGGRSARSCATRRGRATP